jgi:hypothetical protein
VIGKLGSPSIKWEAERFCKDFLLYNEKKYGKHIGTWEILGWER